MVDRTNTASNQQDRSGVSVVELGAELQNDRNDDQAELQVIAQKVGEALLMLQTSDIVFLRTDERPNILQIDRKIIWRQVWTLTYRIT
jgi:hypothetical protein